MNSAKRKRWVGSTAQPSHHVFGFKAEIWAAECFNNKMGGYRDQCSLIQLFKIFSSKLFAESMHLKIQ